MMTQIKKACQVATLSRTNIVKYDITRIYYLLQFVMKTANFINHVNKIMIYYDIIQYSVVVVNIVEALAHHTKGP